MRKRAASDRDDEDDGDHEVIVIDSDTEDDEPVSVSPAADQQYCRVHVQYRHGMTRSIFLGKETTSKIQQRK